MSLYIFTVVMIPSLDTKFDLYLTFTLSNSYNTFQFLKQAREENEDLGKKDQSVKL